MKKLVLVDRDRWIVMCALEKHVSDAYAPYVDAEGEHRYCACGNYIDPQLTRGKKCMPHVYHMRRVAVSIALAVFTCAIAWLGGNLLYS